MGLIEVAQYLLALLFVIGLIGALAWLARRFGPFPGMAGHPKGQARRLQVVESLALDPRRRLVLIRRDGTDHLLLLGHNKDLVVETNIATGIEQPVEKGRVS